MAALLLIFLTLSCQSPAVGGLFEWLQRTETPPPPQVAATPPPPAALMNDARFEVMTTDEKFLSEAKQLELSLLDSCHYRVVAQLKSSCESLTEEKLAKLGVLLFNCQSESEGRPTYPCTDDMLIRDCTAGMDSDTWNAYHIVSNRARAVCYAARQQLFRRRAEHTVNALISTASSQLDAMKELKEGQQELKELTAASLQRLLDGHGALYAQQGRLSEGQQHMESSLTENLQRLNQEKALIASGQQLVAQLIQGITQRMENMSESVQVHGSEVQQSHDAIVNDLAAVRHQAQDIYHKIDHSMSEFLQYQDQTSQYYADLMAKLERMNNTLGVVLLFLDNLQSRVEARLEMILGYLGWTGLSLTAMWTCVVHTCYFVMGAVLLTFLRCPAFPRVTLLLTVMLNAVAEVHQQATLELSSLSMLLLLATMGYWFVRHLWAGLQLSKKQMRPSPLAACSIVKPQKQPVSFNPLYPVSSTPQRNQKDSIDEETDVNGDSFLLGELCISAVSPPDVNPTPESRSMPGTGSLLVSSPRFKPLSGAAAAMVMDDIPLRNLGVEMVAFNNTRHLLTNSRSTSPTPSNISNSSVSSRQFCNGRTKTGKGCKKRAVPGLEFCRIHEGGHSSYVQS